MSLSRAGARTKTHYRPSTIVRFRLFLECISKTDDASADIANSLRTAYAMATQNLMRSFGALSLSATRTIAVKSVAPTTQLRTISTSLLSRPRTSITPSSLAKTAVQAVTQQTRGMKVHSSVKKRCEHCKVGA